MSTLFTASCSGETFSSVLAKLYGDQADEPPAPVDLFAGVEISNFTVDALPQGNAMRTSWTLTVENPNFSHLTLQWGSDDQNSREFAEEGENTYDITELMNNVEYTISIYASDNDGNTSEPVSRTGSPQDILFPQPVANLRTSAPPSGTEARLRWDRPDEDDFERLEITWTPAEGSPPSPQSITNAETTTLTITNLIRLRLYTFTITIYDDDGNESAPVTASVTPGDTTPPGPVTLVSSTPGDQQITLNWTNPTDADFARVEIGIVGGSVNTTALVNIPMDEMTSSYTFMSGTMGSTMVNVQDGTDYTFTLTAFDGSGNGSNPVSETQRTLPGEVGSFTAVTPVADGQIILNWTHPTGDNDSHDMYNITGDATVTVSGTATSTTINTGLADGTNYTFNIVAVDVDGNESVTQATATGRTRPGPVTTFTANTTSTPGEVELNWTNPAGSPNFTGVRITGGGIAPMEVDSTMTSTIIGSLAGGTPHVFNIVARDSVGNESSSAMSSPITLDTTPPGNVMGFMAAVGNGQIILNWNAVTDAASYTITWQPGMGSATSTGTTETIAGLTNGTLYTFMIVAVDTANNPSVTPASVAERPCDTTITTPDMDSDNISDDCDNCPMVANPAQTDNDNDGLGALCDPDVYAAVWSRGDGNGDWRIAGVGTGVAGGATLCRNSAGSNDETINRAGVTNNSDHFIQPFIRFPEIPGLTTILPGISSMTLNDLSLRGSNAWNGMFGNSLVSTVDGFFDSSVTAALSLRSAGVSGGFACWMGSTGTFNSCNLWISSQNSSTTRGRIGNATSTDSLRFDETNSFPLGAACSSSRNRLCVAWPVEAP